MEDLINDIKGFILLMALPLERLDKYEYTERMKNIANGAKKIADYEDEINSKDSMEHNCSIRGKIMRELATWAQENIEEEDEERYNSICEAYKKMYFSAENEKDLKDKINAFRAGNLNP